MFSGNLFLTYFTLTCNKIDGIKIVTSKHIKSSLNCTTLYKTSFYSTVIYDGFLPNISHTDINTNINTNIDTDIDTDIDIKVQINATFKGNFYKFYVFKI